MLSPRIVRKVKICQNSSSQHENATKVKNSEKIFPIERVRILFTKYVLRVYNLKKV